MTRIELNTYKMELLREIVNGFNTESALRKLAVACRLIKEEEMSDLPVMSEALLQEFMSVAASQDEEGLCFTDGELERELEKW